MSTGSLGTYLNDHLAGATFGSDLADQLASETEGSELHATLAQLASEIREDRQTLSDLMDRLGADKNPVKQATTWLAEKGSRVKLAGLSSGEDRFGVFMGLETLSLGVEGKASLWITLCDLRDRYPELTTVDLEELEARARSQRNVLEAARLTAGRLALTNESGD
jgi:hypothetical protein